MVVPMSKTENQNTEFKQEWRDDALKTICAFSNTEGGTVYIGVDEQGISVELTPKMHQNHNFPS